MFEPDMKYCTSCDDEYMPNVENCGVCGQKLVTGAELAVQKQQHKQAVASRKGKLSEEDDIVVIMRAPMADIKRIEQQLADANIGTLAVGDESNCGKGCCGGGDMDLLVRREDAQDAMHIIERDFDKMTAAHTHNSAYADYGFDPSAQKTTCPACGCTFKPEINTCPDCGLYFG